MNYKELLRLEDLTRRYDKKNAPLYISYPTLSWWRTEADEGEYAINFQKAGDVSLYLHFPFCRKACYYCMCYKLADSGDTAKEHYIDVLIKEIELKAARIGGDNLKALKQMHWGGGTPTCFSEKQLKRVFDALVKNGVINPAAREVNFSIEAYPDKQLLESGKLEVLKELGFNEISFGVQDLDPRVQEAINRDCKKEILEELICKCKKLGFRVHVDLCYGLPFQEYGGFKKTIEDICVMQPDRVAMLTYMHYPTVFPLQRKIPAASLPGSFNRMLLARLADDLFGSAGYEKIGIDHYVKSDNNLCKAFKSGAAARDLMGYSTSERKCFVGMGLGAISFTGKNFYHNKQALESYARDVCAGKLPLEENISHTLTEEDIIRNEIIQKGILCYGIIDKTEIGLRFNIDFDIYFKIEMGQLEKYARDGLLSMESPGKIEITEEGKYFARHIAHVFDSYYAK